MTSGWSATRHHPRRIGGWLLLILPLPLLAKMFVALGRGEFGSLLVSAAAFAILMSGAWLTRKGLDQAKRRPMSSTVPFKSIGAAVIALGTALTALIAGHNLVIAVCFGLAVVLGFYLCYGFDRRLKLSSDKDVATALEAAYVKLERLGTAGDNIRSRDFRERLDRIIAWGERILDRIGDDPEDFRRARKFLNVYLDGAQQVTEKFARAQGDAQSAELEQSFGRLLRDMETVCEEQYQRLLDNDLVDLDVQMEVLTTRLKREGVF